MFPIGDDQVRGAGFAFMNMLLIIANVAVFLFQVTMDQASAQDFVTRWGTIPSLVLQGSSLVTLFTSMFLHGGWLHLISNMVFLWVFGDNVEAVMGHFGYLIFYLAGGLAASAAHILLNADSTVPSVGASGAISAVLGAYIVMFPHSRIRTFVFIRIGGFLTRVSAILFLGVWFAIQLFSGVVSIGVNTAQTGGVAFWAHIGGFVFGLLAGLLFRGRAAQLRFGPTRLRSPY